MRLRECVGSLDQAFVLNSSGVLTQVALGGECLAPTSCHPAGLTGVSLVTCGDFSCGAGSSEQQWRLDASGRLSSALSGEKLCLALASVDGPGVNLWSCAAPWQNNNTQWHYDAKSGAITTMDARVGAASCLTREEPGPGPGAIAVLNASAAGRALYGVGGLAAIGGARLIYEYVEPQRTQILDLLFNTSGGSAFQVIKTEMEGDMDSSYGSGPSFMHSRDEAPSFQRGIYLPWLLGEAKRRNPSVGTYALAWGLPGWVGTSSGDKDPFLSQDSLDYHMAYFNGVREVYNYSFSTVGIHNERNWSRDWVKALRAALDAAGFEASRISVNDASNGGCEDCGGFPDSSITTAAASDPAFARALGTIGLHSPSLLPKGGWDWEAAGKDYIQSENNDVDGPLIPTASGVAPQWEGNVACPLGPGLAWPRRFLQNYLEYRITGTIICPLSHAWTWSYGRHNHGTALFIQPWSGNYVLGAAFWGQAHFTQATRPGWRFLDGSASGQWINASESSEAWLTYGTLVSPDLASDISIVAVNSHDSRDAPLAFQLVDSLAKAFSGRTLHVWLSNASAQFFQLEEALPIPPSGAFAYSLPPRTVLTLTTLSTLSHATPPIPPRAPFPLPYASAFAQQRAESPGALLSDLFGAFYAAPDPLGVPPRRLVLRQAMPAGVGRNSWLGRDGCPFTSLPSPGTALANVNLTLSALLMTADLAPSGLPAPGNLSASLCGRVPIWQPTFFSSPTLHLGLCLTLTGDGQWALQQNGIAAPPLSSVLAHGPLPAGAPPALDAWHSLGLDLYDDSAAAWVDGVQVALVGGVGGGLGLSAGVPGLGSGMHVAHFDNLTVTPGGAGVNKDSWCAVGVFVCLFFISRSLSLSPSLSLSLTP